MTELLLALGIPTAYLLLTPLVVLNHRERLPGVLQRLSTRNAIAWNTMVDISIALGALRWALSRQTLRQATFKSCGVRTCCSAAWRRGLPRLVTP